LSIRGTRTGIGIWLRQRLQHGGCFVDIGANVGAYSALAADIVGPSGHVYAFEPAPENAAKLRERFVTVSQVSIIEAAVGDVSRTVRLYLDAENPTQHSLGSHNVGRGGGAVKVQQRALDDVKGLRPPDVIKIDAQGGELRVLQGARHVLESARPFIVFELWPYGLKNLRADPADLLAELKPAGYTLFKLALNGRLKDEKQIVNFLARPSRWRHIDVVAVPPHRPAGVIGRAWQSQHAGWFATRLRVLRWFARPSPSLLRPS
jgi:FkbM family methyltransferase